MSNHRSNYPGIYKESWGFNSPQEPLDEDMRNQAIIGFNRFLRDRLRRLMKSASMFLNGIVLLDKAAQDSNVPAPQANKDIMNAFIEFKDQLTQDIDDYEAVIRSAHSKLIKSLNISSVKIAQLTSPDDEYLIRTIKQHVQSLCQRITQKMSGITQKILQVDITDLTKMHEFVNIMQGMYSDAEELLEFLNTSPDGRQEKLSYIAYYPGIYKKSQSIVTSQQVTIDSLIKKIKALKQKIKTLIKQTSLDADSADLIMQDVQQCKKEIGEAYKSIRNMGGDKHILSHKEKYPGLYSESQYSHDQTNDPTIFQDSDYADLLKTRDQVLSRVKGQGYNLFFAPQFQDDKEIVLEAVTNSGIVLDAASERLQDDEEVVKAAIENEPAAIMFASERLQDKFAPEAIHAMSQRVFKKAEKDDGWPDKLKEGRFTEYCKRQGFSGPCKECADKAMDSDDASVRGMASFYLNTVKP
ncbi:MAG: DUF4116 domain-containing protein [Elusimicrobiota bacterium]